MKVAIVTAASSGIGLEISRYLAFKGWNLIIASRSEKIKSISEELGALYIQGDIQKNSVLEDLIETALSNYGHIDGVVINTGHAPKGSVFGIDDSDWNKGSEMYLMPVVRLLRILAPIFNKQKNGSVVAVSSYAAKEPDPMFPLSSIYRAALAAYIKLATLEANGNGWRINAILPGYMNNYPENLNVCAKIPMKRYGRIYEELAPVVNFLLSEESSYINGQGVVVDGGLIRSL